MKPAIIIAVIIAVLAAACAPRQTLIATGVSRTLTAMVPTSVLPPDRLTSTAVPTLALPTVTPPPTEPPALEPTLVPTDAPTENPVVTSTATLPAAVVGELIFADTFDSAGAWAPGDFADNAVTVSGGVLSFTQKTPGAFSFRIIGRQGSDFHAEVQAALANNCGSGDRYGLMFRTQDPNSYYAFQIDCEGRYRFVRYVSGAGAAIIDWTPTPAIERGAQSANTLGVTAVGGAFTFAINGTPASTAGDTSFAKGGFGLMVGSNVTKNFTVIFDDLRVSKVP